MGLKFINTVIFIQLCLVSFSQVFDAQFDKDMKKNEKVWNVQDSMISIKLDSLRKVHGKTPNIIYILTDDIGWGDLGWQGGGKHRGVPSPTLDKMANEGMRFWSAYAEPSCTPTRVAINTGRHPVRTGLISVLWPGQEEGLSPKEVTLAEMLKKADYNTAMWGKWHLGDAEEHSPVNQGFDYAYYGLYNGAPDAWQDSKDLYNNPMPIDAKFGDFPGYEDYEEATGIDLSVAGYVHNKGEERKPIAGPAGKLGFDRQEVFENESNTQMISYIKDKSKSDNPFFIYWASYACQLTGAKEFQNDPDVDKMNAQASIMLLHNKHVQNIIETLESEKIAENTLIVWYSDNGPMYGFYPTSSYSLLKGGKGTVLEGGVRVPAMALWPGMILPNQAPKDIIHVTDLFTTACKIAGVYNEIPNNRITDGIDQTALLFFGDDYGRRKYMMHYSGDQLAAFRYNNFKIHVKEGHGGLPGMDFYNIKRDPGERYGALYPGLFAVSPIQTFIEAHKNKIKKYPHRKPSESKSKK